MPCLDKVNTHLGRLLHNVVAYPSRNEGVGTCLHSRLYVAFAVTADNGYALDGVVCVGISYHIRACRLLNSVGEVVKSYRLVNIAYSAEEALAKGSSVEYSDKVAELVVYSACYLVKPCVEGEYGNAVIKQLDNLPCHVVILGN